MTAPRPTARRAAAALGVLLAAASLVLAFVFPVFRHPSYWGVEDWDVHFFYSDVARAALRYGQLPLWDPYYCGGMPLLGHPESRFLSPFFLLNLAFGAPLAAKLSIALHLLLALLGTWRLSRRAGLSSEGAALAACAFAFSGLFAVNLATGDFFAPAAYAPWLLSFAVDGFASPGAVAGAASVLALAFCEGGAVVAPLLGFCAACAAAGAAAGARSARPLLKLCAVGALAAGLAAVKLLPAGELMRRYPRPGADYSGLSAGGLADALLEPDQLRTRDAGVPGFWRGSSWSFDENGMYLGWAAAALAVLGLAACWRRQAALTALLAGSAWVSMGDRISPSAWELLRRLPVLESMRVASRFRLGMALALAVFAGLGLERLLRAVPPRRRSLAAGAALAVVLAQLWRSDARVWALAFVVPPPRVEPAPAFRQTALDPSMPPRRLAAYVRSGTTAEGGQRAFTAEYGSLLAGRGLVDCNSQLLMPRAAAPVGSPRYRGEAYVDGAPGEARYDLWTPNRLRLRYRASAPARLVVNQNYWPHWRAATPAGPVPVEPHEGLLSVAVPQGEGVVTLDYRPWTAAAGASLSALTALILLAAALRRRGARR